MRLTEIVKQFKGSFYFDGFKIFYKPTKEERSKKGYFNFPAEYVDLYELYNDSFIVSDLDTKDMNAGDCALMKELVDEISEFTEYGVSYVEEHIEFLLMEDNVYIMKFNDDFIRYNLDYKSWMLTDRIADIVNVYGESLKDVLF